MNSPYDRKIAWKWTGAISKDAVNRIVNFRPVLTDEDIYQARVQEETDRWLNKFYEDCLGPDYWMPDDC